MASGRSWLSSGPVYREEERGVNLSGTGWLMVEQYSRWARGCPLIDVDEREGYSDTMAILRDARAYIRNIYEADGNRRSPVETYSLSRYLRRLARLDL